MEVAVIDAAACPFSCLGLFPADRLKLDSNLGPCCGCPVGKRKLSTSLLVHRNGFPPEFSIVHWFPTLLMILPPRKVVIYLTDLICGR